MARRSDRMDTIVSLCKRRGIVFPSSEIYGGLRAAWDYGPLGVELKNNIKRQWWRSMVQARDDIVGLDSSRDPRPRGLAGQRPPHRVRRPADRVPVLPQAVPRRPPDRGVRGEARPPAGGRPGRPRLPELRHQGRVHRAADVQRPAAHPPRRRPRTSPAWPTCGPETAQGIFINFLNVLQTSRKKPPFGIAQIGKSFRNEITPGNFIFRTREFEQMEMEFFVKPGTDEEWHEYWIETRMAWYLDLGLRRGQPAALRAPRGEAVALLQAHRRHRVPLRLRRAPSGASSRASPTAPTST